MPAGQDSGTAVGRTGVAGDLRRWRWRSSLLTLVLTAPGARWDGISRRSGTVLFMLGV
jgi:hypothetical protein